MWKNIKEWLSSKKAKALVLALLMLGVALGMGEINAKEFLTGGIAALSVYMGAQGIADIGKEKAKVDAKVHNALNLAHRIEE